MTIRNVDREEKETLGNIVDIHVKTFDGFFLTFLGKGFLFEMYKAHCSDEKSGLFCAFDDTGKPVGFLAYSEDISGLYKYMIKTKLIPFAWYSFCAFLKNPGIFMRLLRALSKPDEVKRSENYVELASIGVLPEMMSRGIGTELIDRLKDTVDFKKNAYIKLETDAVDNDAANSFYIKNGFYLESTYETPEGRKMNEYRYRK